MKKHHVNNPSQEVPTCGQVIKIHFVTTTNQADVTCAKCLKVLAQKTNSKALWAACNAYYDSKKG